MQDSGWLVRRHTAFGGIFGFCKSACRILVGWSEGTLHLVEYLDFVSRHAGSELLHPRSKITSTGRHIHVHNGQDLLAFLHSYISLCFRYLQCILLLNICWI